jgi:hypothetical protein
MKRLMLRVKKKLAAGSDELGAREIAVSEFLTAIVYSLELDFEAHITKIMCDQWCGVWAESATLETMIQCDEVEHGIAATWEAFAKHKAG